jgi:hypothetical protein
MSFGLFDTAVNNKNVAAIISLNNIKYSALFL